VQVWSVDANGAGHGFNDVSQQRSPAGDGRDGIQAEIGGRALAAVSGRVAWRRDLRFGIRGKRIAHGIPDTLAMASRAR
jgi:hypothetical protein